MNDTAVPLTQANVDRPLLVVVHGPPGSGKSTLARALGRELRLPVFQKDAFKDLAFDTLGSSDRQWSIRVGGLSMELLYLCAAQLLNANSSCVVESNFRPADEIVARFRELRRTTPYRSVEVFCFADPEALWERFDARRHAGDRNAGHVGFEARSTFLDDLRTRPHGPLALADALLEIDTTGSFPSSSHVAAWIRERAAS